MVAAATLKVFSSEVLNLWDYTRNTPGPNYFSAGSGKRVYWVCIKGHSWRAAIRSVVKNGTRCPYCANKKACFENSIEGVRPDLVSEYDMNKNSLPPSKVISKSDKKLWWKCASGHEWKASGMERVSSGHGCPYCSGRRVSDLNRLTSVHPILSREWDYSKNTFGPEEISFGSGKKVWWTCGKHSWRATVCNRVLGRGCPYCSRKRACPDNNLLVTHPTLCKQWDYEKNQEGPERFLSGTHTKAWWLCDNGHSWKASITNRATHGRGCPECAATQFTSNKAIAWLDLLGVAKREVLLYTKYGVFKVDGFDAATNTVYEFMGDYWHGNPVVPKYWEGANAHNGMRFKDLYNKTLKKLSRMKKAGFSVVSIWERDYDTQVNILQEVRLKPV